MQYPKGSGRKNAEVISDGMRGLNRQPKGTEGYFSDCLGVASDKYPCISSAAGYEVVEAGYTNIQAAMTPMYGATKFCGVADGVFYWDGEEIKTSAECVNIEATSEVNMFALNKYIYIQEKRTDGRSKVYRYDVEVRTYDDNEAVSDYLLEDAASLQELGCKVIKDGLITTAFDKSLSKNVTVVKYGDIMNSNDGEGIINGEVILLGEEEIDQFMYYRENTGELTREQRQKAVKCYLGDAGSGLQYYTAINGNTINLSYYNGYYGVGNYFKKIWFCSAFGKDTNPNCNLPQTLNKIYYRITPECSPFITYKNRVWGGKSDGNAVIASAFGKGDDFWEFQSAASDSVEISIATPGEFVGLKVYGDSLLCFKADSITVIYGDTADDFMIGKEIPGVGCIDIRSCQTIDGVLYFLGGDGFYSYSGGWPQFISNNIATRYEKAVAFSKDGKYFAECERADGEKELLIYDTRRNIWLKEAVQGIKGVYYKDGETYIVTKDAVKRVRTASEYETQSEEWFIESMDLY